MTAKVPDHSIVYAAVNLINDKIYVGATMRQISVRKSQHIHCAKRGQRGAFYSAIRKHGKENFKFLTIHKCVDFFEALEFERIYISKLQPEYNMTAGGGGIRGYTFSAESRAKMSASSMGRKANVHAAHESRRKQVRCLNTLKVFSSVSEAAGYFGISVPQATLYCRGRRSRSGIRLEYLLGTPSPRIGFTEEHREACRQRICLVSVKKRKKVKCRNDGAEFASVMEAARHYGLNEKSLATVARGERGSVNGLKFEYAA